jgi:hypothetical protein
MSSSGMLRCQSLVRTDASKKRIPSVITVTKIGQLDTTEVTSN